MTNHIQTPIIAANRRVFRYNDHTIDDPEPAYSVDQVRQALVPFFPELTRATVEEETLADGTLQITFRKQATTKGSLIAEVASRLETLLPYDDPLLPLLQQIGTSEVTLQTILDARDAIAAVHDDVYRQNLDTQKAVERCLRLRPIPLDCLPLGF